MSRVKILPYKKVWDPKPLSPLAWRLKQSWEEGLEMLVACTSRGNTIALDWTLGGEGDRAWLKCHKLAVVTST